MSEISAALEAMTRLSRYLMAAAAKDTLADNQIIACKALLSEWQEGDVVEENDCFRYEDKVYRCRQAHTTQSDWRPDATPALWAVIDVTHAGTAADPIPASRGMDYTYGRYYRDPEDGLVYLCTRAGEAEGGTVTLQYLPHELVGNYFTLEAN